MTKPWPKLDYEEQIWDGGQIASMGPAATRLSMRGAKYHTAVPSMIVDLVPEVDREVELLAREAELELARFDTEVGLRLAAFGPILLRSEATSSSQIENLTASARQIFTAELGGRVARNASEVAANTRAMLAALELSDELSSESMREMHRVLMEGQDRHTPGDFRAQSVWIGSRAYSPIGASYVAPAASRVPELMSDLAAFCERDDMPALVHVAVAHAQFETIHPFSDGNGRTGRALAQAMLRRSQVTRSVAVPVSAGLLTDVRGYHDALTAYRDGDPSPIVEKFAAASLRAVPNGRQLMAELDQISQDWRELAAPRTGSAKERLLRFALERPVFTAEIAARDLGIAPSNVYRYLQGLQEVGVLAFKAEYRGPAVWRAPAVLEAIDRFAERAGKRGSEWR
ncbi:Fic family protein [Leucobacter insecticola]|uniref:Fic family protein n=2 Tax=Leucobacter insecticola TaxID=2714934 RepID=A0A6G8FM06_9MICO|nr:Fic family protein [Leucobacter insecticola]